MTSLIIALVSFATALVGGVLLSKAYFVSRMGKSVAPGAHRGQMILQRERFQEQIKTLHKAARKKLAGQKSKIDLQAQEIEQLRLEVQDLSATREYYDDKLVDTLRVEIDVIREHLGTRDDRIKALELDLKDSHIEKQELLTELNKWKQRVSPLTKKLHEQKELLEETSQLETLRARIPDNDLSDEENSDDEAVAAANPASDTSADEVDRKDDLKKIRGIGPALERRLNGTGIRNYRQIAEMSEQDINDIAGKIFISPSQVVRGKWIRQARDLQQTQVPVERRFN